MSSFVHFRKAIVIAGPYLLLVCASYFAFSFLPEALGRMYLWIFVYHFAPYANHADGVRELFDSGTWAVIAAAIPFMTTWRTPRRARTVSLFYFGVVTMIFLIFWVMVKTHGFVSYEEFVAHGV